MMNTAEERNFLMIYRSSFFNIAAKLAQIIQHHFRHFPQQGYGTPQLFVGFSVTFAYEKNRSSHFIFQPVAMGTGFSLI
jgi:hypothetical protein